MTAAPIPKPSRPTTPLRSPIAQHSLAICPRKETQHSLHLTVSYFAFRENRSSLPFIFIFPLTKRMDSQFSAGKSDIQ
jgi:hypothetical protein